MQIAIVLVVLVAVAAASDYKSMFQSFKSQHARNYESAEEEGKRFDIFVENMKSAEKLNKINPLARFGVNEFADMSAAEFKTRHNADQLFTEVTKRANSPADAYTMEEVNAAVSTIDWRTKGAVTAVKNQGNCGSCWAFSTTGAVEGQWFLAGNKLTSLSEQLFVSCDTFDDGCHGGLVENALAWVVNSNNGELVTEASYPYVSGNHHVPACNKSGKAFGANITGYRDLPHNEDQMAAFVSASGPLSIAVDATSWHTYKGGILTNCQSVRIDHGVLIVGYDKASSPPYWIVKNSWGDNWGESGYIRLEFGTNQCLINTYPTTPLVPGAPNSPTPVPGPTPPPAPTPTGSGIKRSSCEAPDCTNCTVQFLPMNQCVPWTPWLQKNIKASQMAVACNSTGAYIRQWPMDQTCLSPPGWNGPAMKWPSNGCNRVGENFYIRDECYGN